MHATGPNAPGIAQITRQDLWAALDLGWRDFRAAPSFGLVFSSVYVLGGLFLAFVSGGFVWQTLILALAFPLLAPFAAVGLYEVSRRRSQNRALVWPEILAVVWAERDRQIPWLGAVIVMYMLFYVFLSHMLFALFMGLSPMTNVSTSFEAFLTVDGLTMIAAQLIVGGGVAWLLFMLTAFSLAMALDRDVDFVTAMITSFQAVQRNAGVMALWAAGIAVSVVAAMVPFFLGLLVVLPLLGHATWHLYDRVMRRPT